MKSGILLILLLNAVVTKSSEQGGRMSEKKRVRFRSESINPDFSNFTVQVTQKNGSAPQMQKTKPLTEARLPLKSALKNNSNLSNANGVFGISSEADNQAKFAPKQAHQKSMRIDSFSSSSYNGAAPPKVVGQVIDNNINYSSSLPTGSNNPFRNIGPTPEIISDLSPRRFWVPQNAPMQNRIEGPWLPYSFGVPGGPPAYGNDLPVYDAYSPQVTGLTGPRDPVIAADPRSQLSQALETGVAVVGNYQPPYEPPCIIPPLKPVTPIPGGNITDPLSPTVTNVRGPFFPNEPLQDHAFLYEQPEQPDIDEGFYEVERIVDPIVFFDPSQSQTVLFDPINNITRPFDPEIDPELPLDEELLGSGNNNGALLKSTGSNGLKSLDKPAFWILKKVDQNNNHLDPMRQYEKALINGQPQSGKGNGFVELQANHNQNLQKMQDPKRKRISYKKKAHNLQKSTLKKPESTNFKIQVAADTKEQRISIVNPNVSDANINGPKVSNPNINNGSSNNGNVSYNPSIPKRAPSRDQTNNIKPNVPIQKSPPNDFKKPPNHISSTHRNPRKPLIDPNNREKPFNGFKSKAQGNSATKISPSTALLKISFALLFTYIWL